MDEFCIWATILQTCLALRWGAQLADVWTCLAFALRTCIGVPNLGTSLVLHLGAHLADVPCVALGRPTLVRPYQKVYLQEEICSYPSSSSSSCLVLPCVDVFVADEFFVWATILRTLLALRWGAQLADVQTCLAFTLRTCIGAPNLWTWLALHRGTQPW